MAILSIQSHVAYGYAGNTAAVFPLQRLGREVWAVNTVEFSNHTGYGAWRGKVLDVSLAEELVAGIEDRGVLGNCEAVLSGYMGDAGVGHAVIGAVQKVKAVSPRAIYCCDPVMGDLGRGFYVHPDIPDMFKNEVIPRADIITPNQFELEALTGLDTSGLVDVRKAIDQLHAVGPKVVLVTSYRENGGVENHIDMLASDGSSIYRVRTPELPMGAGMAGSGDVTTAIFLSRYLETGNVRDTLELTAASIFGIMDATYKAKSRELQIIKAQAELVNPSNTFKAEKL
ncbi:pyridoxal kinase PdxY [Treponema primitia]|uniref:pyridoxal kinase PdxY n=1 Tax=Treponema primitia TaxID=88058 RepID=UPI00397FD564